MNTSPSRVARVTRPARSEPPLGSERNCTHSSSPERIAGMCRCFCSSVPKSSRVGARIDKRRDVEEDGHLVGRDSWVNACWWARVRPWPPYSTGKQIPAKPPSKRVRCSSPGPVAHLVLAASAGGCSGPRGGAACCSASQARARSRNASTSSASSAVVHRLLRSATAPPIAIGGDPLPVVARASRTGPGPGPPAGGTGGGRGPRSPRCRRGAGRSPAGSPAPWSPM